MPLRTVCFVLVKVASFGRIVAYVVRLRSNEKMLGIKTTRIITTMQNTKAGIEIVAQITMR